MSKTFFLIFSMACLRLNSMSVENNNADLQHSMIEGYLSFAWSPNIARNEQQAFITTKKKLKISNPREAAKLTSVDDEDEILVRMNVSSRKDFNDFNLALKGSGPCFNGMTPSQFIPQFFSYCSVSNLKENEQKSFRFNGNVVSLIAKQQNSFAHSCCGSPELFQDAGKEYRELFPRFRAMDQSQQRTLIKDKVTLGLSAGGARESLWKRNIKFFSLAGLGLAATYFTAKYFGFNPLSLFKILKFKKR
jgi:hypothetical protein